MEVITVRQCKVATRWGSVKRMAEIMLPRCRHSGVNRNNMRERSFRCWVSLVTALAVAGCGSSAAIVQLDGRVTDGKILRSDRHAIYVEAPSGDQPIRVDRGSIRDIDHPGVPTIVAGTVLLSLLGLMMLGRDFRDDLFHGPRGDTGGYALPLTIMFGAPGAGLLGFGLYRRVSSTQAAAPPKNALDE